MRGFPLTLVKNMTLESLPILLTLGCLVGGLCYSNWRDRKQMGQPLIFLAGEEEKQLQECFPSSIYYLQNLEYRNDEICCYGQLRSPNFKYSYDTVSYNLKQAFGDRFLCYLKEESMATLPPDYPERLGNASALGNYCFHIVARSSMPSRRSRKRLVARSIVSAIATFIALIAWGTNLAPLPEIHLDRLLLNMPYVIAVMLIFMARTIAQYYITRKYEMRFIPPLYIPWLGNWAVLSPLQQSRQNKQTIKLAVKDQRKILFDLGAFPNIAGLLVAILLIVCGNWLFLSIDPPIADPVLPILAQSFIAKFINVFQFQNSILTALIHSICQAIAPNQLTTQSPLTLAGWTGLAISAVQILPFEFLDGGNLAIAMYNHQQVCKIAQVSRLLILAIALLIQPWLRVYALLLFLLPMPRPLVLNEGLEVDRTRDYIGFTVIAIALLILLPLPK